MEKQITVDEYVVFEDSESVSFVFDEIDDFDYEGCLVEIFEDKIILKSSKNLKFLNCEIVNIEPLYVFTIKVHGFFLVAQLDKENKVKTAYQINL